MSNAIDASVSIDTELFIWAAKQGSETRLRKSTILTKEEFKAQESMKNMGASLANDMYLAYRAGFKNPGAFMDNEERMRHASEADMAFEDKQDRLREYNA